VLLALAREEQRVLQASRGQWAPLVDKELRENRETTDNEARQGLLGLKETRVIRVRPVFRGPPE